MTQQIRPKAIAPSFRTIAPSILPASNSWNINDLESRKRESTGSIDSPAKHFHNSTGVYSNSPMDSADGTNEALTADQKARRKEQNRAAQRAFRDRKEKYVKELEQKIKMMEKSHAQELSRVEQENQALREKVIRLEQELKKRPKDGDDDMDMDMDMTTSALEATTINGQQSPVASDHHHHHHQQQQQQQQQESTLDKNSNKNDGYTMTLYSSSPATTTTTTTTNTSPITPRTSMPSSAVACIRDKDGVSFCERLKEEVCSSAYNQLLSEPLFDASGSLNETVTNHPVPIVTDRMNGDHPVDDDDRHRFDMYDDPMYFLDRLNEILATERFDLLPPHPDTLSPDVHLIPCSKVWQTLSAHPKFDAFDVDVLCDELKLIAKCSNTGPVFTEHELQALVRRMEKLTDGV